MGVIIEYFETGGIEACMSFLVITTSIFAVWYLVREIRTWNAHRKCIKIVKEQYPNSIVTKQGDVAKVVLSPEDFEK